MLVTIFRSKKSACFVFFHSRQSLVNYAMSWLCEVKVTNEYTMTDGIVQRQSRDALADDDLFFVKGDLPCILNLGLC
jgi:hypothetical protein